VTFERLMRVDNVRERYVISQVYETQLHFGKPELTCGHDDMPPKVVKKISRYILWAENLHKTSARPLSSYDVNTALCHVT